MTRRPQPTSIRMAAVACSLAAAALLAACAGAGPVVPNAAPARESGQSALMGQTFAGQNRCNAKEHDRPFIVEWDATDASSFQARAATDVVFVKYEGCNLTIVDSCADDSVPGTLGSYKPVDWTAGALEKVDIDNVIDLYAKLPLGVALLGGRVQSGEKFHMEYFVSGTRSATRPAVYRGDVGKMAGCAGATHFVYAYNLGAFALGSRSKINGEVGATVWGAGAGASRRSSSAIDKQGGDLTACRGDAAKEVDGCKVPIRLTLREITDGDSPTAQAARAPESDAALSLASALQASTKAERDAQEHGNAAQTKRLAGDGRGCLAELDQHDRLDPRPGGLSTSSGAMASLRAVCIMLAGQCEAGKGLLRKVLLAQQSVDVESGVDHLVAQNCKDGGHTDRDHLIRALYVLHDAASSAGDCRHAYDVAKAMQPKVTARNNSDPAFQTDYKLREAATCFARAGDCVAAWHAAKEQAQAFADHAGRKSDDELSRSFMTDATKDLCTGKDQGTLTDSETFYRDMAELSGVSRDAPPAPGFCNERVTLAQAALSRIMQGPQASAFKDARAPERLFASASQCLATSGDCAGAWHTALDLERKWAGPDNTDPDARARGHFRDRAPACALKPQGAMGPRDTVFWAAGVLQDATRSGGDAGVCRGALGAALRAAPADPEDRSVNTPWHYATRDIPRYAGRCLRAAQDCGAAWAIYQDAYPVFGYPQSTDVRRMFESDVSDCKGK